MDGNQWRTKADCANYNLMLNSENIGGVGVGRRSKTTDMSMARNISLFNKYLFERAHQNINRGAEIRTKPRCGAPLLPYQTHEFRMPSFLEREFILGIKSGRRAPKSINIQPRPMAQLTIFYAGTVNVYDDVPVDKAEAIMLLAGGTASSSKPSKSRSVATGSSTASRVVTEKRTADIDVPMARKLSLHRFLEKRRDRIVNVAPYFSIKREVNEAKPLNV